MAFPILPKEGDDEALFEIQDPFELRRSIIPLFQIDRETNRVYGKGTAFRVDPFATYLTAYHVFENQGSSDFSSRDLGATFGFLSSGLVFGTVSVPTDCYVFVDSMEGYRGHQENPMPGRRHTVVNIFDCAKFWLNPNSPRVAADQPFVPLEINPVRYPQVGDRVMAVGYPWVMGVDGIPLDSAFTYTRGQYAAIGTITEIVTSGVPSRPWPTLRVEGKWPSGISGGPIYNEDGHVIGLVSSGSYNEKAPNELSIGNAFWFAPLPMMRSWLPHVDSDNPGHVRGWGVICMEPWHLAGVHRAREGAEKHQAELGSSYQVRWGSNRPGTDNFMMCSADELTGINPSS